MQGGVASAKKAHRAHDEAGEVNFAVIPFANMLRSNAGERVRDGGHVGVYVARVCVCCGCVAVGLPLCVGQSINKRAT